jgi:hypothetical protein
VVVQEHRGRQVRSPRACRGDRRLWPGRELVHPGESGGFYACASYIAMKLHLPRNQTRQDSGAIHLRSLRVVPPNSAVGSDLLV